MNIEILIDKVTTETITKLRKSKMINDNEKKAFKKTEDVLRNYEKLLIAVNSSDNTDKTRKLINVIDKALDSISDDFYYEIIPLLYFKGETRDNVAEHFNCDAKTITRNKKRLINKLKLIIFSDDSVSEIFFE